MLLLLEDTFGCVVVNIDISLIYTQLILIFIKNFIIIVSKKYLKDNVFLYRNMKHINVTQNDYDDRKESPPVAFCLTLLIKRYGPQ